MTLFRLFPALIAAASLVAQDIDLTGYTLTFEDNFDTLSVDSSPPTKDSSTWYFWPPYGPSGDYGGVEWSVANTQTVQGGVLNITAWYDPALDASHAWKEWRSGNISSKDERAVGFSQRFGYFSARIKMPDAGTGAFPAFWLFSDNAIQSRNTGQRLEIDIMEWFGKNPANSNGRSYASSIHNWNDNGSQGENSLGQFHAINKDLINEWHVYGCLWRPDYTAFFLDGVEVFRVPTNLAYCNDPAFIMVDYALGGGWPLSGEPYASRGTSSMQVDWVRAYSLPANVQIPPVAPITIENPGFEKDADGAQESIGWGEWSSVNANYAGRVVSVDSHSGANHFRMEGTNFNLLLSQVAQVRETGIYTFRAWAKTSTEALLLLQDYAGPNRQQQIPDIDTWTMVEIKDIQMAAGSSIRLGPWTTTGWAAFDDVEFFNQTQSISPPQNVHVVK
jgi:beta-glucanase (GH16 family)